jgi:hypothetical protein
MVKILNRRKRLLSLIAFAALTGALVLLPSAAARATDVGVRMGYYFDANAFSIGTELLSPIGDNPGQWYFNPNVELAMGEHRDLAALNADFHYDLDTGSNTAVWVGAGPVCSSSTGMSRTTTPTWIRAEPHSGSRRETRHYRPFVQGKGILSDNSEAALAVGIRF